MERLGKHVAEVLFERSLDVGDAFRVARQFVATLRAVLALAMDFVLPLIDELAANLLEHRHHHTVEQMMALEPDNL